jgi:hypothetical protein
MRAKFTALGMKETATVPFPGIWESQWLSPAGWLDSPKANANNSPSLADVPPEIGQAANQTERHHKASRKNQQRTTALWHN